MIDESLRHMLKRVEMTVTRFSLLRVFLLLAIGALTQLALKVLF
jgi:hypothetical protein